MNLPGRVGGGIDCTVLRVDESALRSLRGQGRLMSAGEPVILGARRFLVDFVHSFYGRDFYGSQQIRLHECPVRILTRLVRTNLASGLLRFR